MKVAVIADTHGDISFAKKVLSRHADIDRLIHLGDHSWDAKALQSLFKVPVDVVRGNNDYGEKAPYDKLIRLAGHKILLTHGHKYNVYFGPDHLYYRAREIGASYVFYGHTHQYRDDMIDGIRLINPGSASLPRDGQAESLVIMEVDKASIKIERILNI